MKFTTQLLLIICTFSCGVKQSNAISPVAKEYIEEVISLLEDKSINRNQIDWKAFREDIYLHANNAQKVEDTYPSIYLAVSKLQDGHSYFAPKNFHDEEDLKPLPVLSDEVVPPKIGYIRIPFCMGDDSDKAKYINEITTKIIAQDNTNLKGWIVDLRGNFGGDMSPMLLAVRPILGEGVLGHFYYPDNTYHVWNYEESEHLNSYRLKVENPYVAVLTDSLTASSGEAVTIAFKGRAKSKSFGSGTYGVSTGNKSHTLSDGSRINLTENTFADRNKVKYGKSVVPDIVCRENLTLQTALNWIGSQQN